MDIGCYKSAINRRPAIHTHAWFPNKHALTDAYAMTLNSKTSVPATSAQDMNKSWKKFQSQGASRFAAAFVCFFSLHWLRPDPVWSCGLCPSCFWPSACSLLCTACCWRLLLFLRLLFPHLQLPRTGKYLHTHTHSGCLLAWPWQRLCLGHTMPSLLLPFYASPVQGTCSANSTDLRSHFHLQRHSSQLRSLLS